MSSKINLHFVSSTSGSIFEITKDLLTSFEDHFNVTKEWEGEVPDINKRDVLLVHFYDKDVVDTMHLYSFKKKILIQPIDGTSIKEEFIDGMNKFDLIIVPAQASKDILILNGIIVPIEIIPNFYKADLFEKEIYTDISKHIPSNKIIFYHESTLHPRKGIELLYEGFVKAFSDTEFADKVVLIIKDQEYNLQTFSHIEKLKRQTIKLQKKYKHPAKILKFSGHLNDNELKELWSACDIYVSLAKIEGFGIPMLRMFLLGKPIIALNNQNSGYLDYLNENNSYLIPILQNIAKNEFMYLYDKKTMWAIPNINTVVDYFKSCLNDFRLGKHKCINTTLDNYDLCIKKYSYKNVSKKYIDLIQNIFNFNN